MTDENRGNTSNATKDYSDYPTRKRDDAVIIADAWHQITRPGYKASSELLLFPAASHAAHVLTLFLPLIAPSLACPASVPVLKRRDSSGWCEFCQCFTIYEAHGMD